MDCQNEKIPTHVITQILQNGNEAIVLGGIHAKIFQQPCAINHLKIGESMLLTYWLDDEQHMALTSPVQEFRYNNDGSITISTMNSKYVLEQFLQEE